MFRYLTADEIDCRVATINKNGLTLLLYKDARVDQNILDETFGVFGWQRSHQLIGDRLYCTVSVKNPETGEWISKQDVGTESYTEKEKGQASDSFKRACFNLGIGRELYTAPHIKIPSDRYNAVEKNGRVTTYDRFRVAEIKIDEGKITYLSINNLDHELKQVFVYKGTTDDLPSATDEEVANAQLNQTKSEVRKAKANADAYAAASYTKKIGSAALAHLEKVIEENGILVEYVCTNFGVDTLADLSEKDYQLVVNNADKCKAASDKWAARQ